MPGFEIHPKLLADCRHMGRLDECHVLLHRNAALPWFVLVPPTDTQDLLDLESGVRDRIIADCSLISRFVKVDLGYPKVNFASIGNVVPQMHLHVVGRRRDDPCWPAPVWGNLEPTRAYSTREIDELRHGLENLGLRPKGDFPA
jgi:diadenosine tetraphosphate (Ap4A) HIT family hydrolase